LVKLPFEEHPLGDDNFLRTFSSDCQSEDFKWHIDLEDRKIKNLEPTDWKFQFDNQLPIAISGEIFVPAGVWHRLIKGSGILKLQITKIF
jgi:hypothetical protein